MPPKSDPNKVIIKDTIRELLSDEVFVKKVIDKIIEKVNLAEYKNKVDEQEQKICKLEKDLDYLQQLSLIKNVRISGIREEKNENLYNKIKNIFTTKMELTNLEGEIEDCYRTGNASSGKPRAVIVKFYKYETKKTIIKNRKKLKNSGIFINEHLTRNRAQILYEVTLKFGKNNAWAMDGKIYVINNGNKHIIHSRADLLQLTEREVEADIEQNKT